MNWRGKNRKAEKPDSTVKEAPVRALSLVEARKWVWGNRRVEKASQIILNSVGHRLEGGEQSYDFHFQGHCLSLQGIVSTSSYGPVNKMAIAFDSELVYYSEAARDAKCPNDSMKHCRQPLVEIFIPDDDWLNLIEWLEISANAYHDAVADRTKNSVIESYVRHLSGEEFEENTMTQLVLTGRENE